MKHDLAILLVSAILIIPNFMGVGNWLQPNYAIAARPAYVPSDDWVNSMYWLRDNTPKKSVVMAWWDYGYYIERIGQRKTVGNPSQNPVRLKAIGESFIGDNLTFPSNYVVIDQSTVMGKFWAIVTWAGKNPDDFLNIYYSPQKDNNLYPIQLFFEPYYKSMVTQLYWDYDNEFLPQQVNVISSKIMTIEGKDYHVITDARQFSNYSQAESFVSKNKGYQIVGIQPDQSPFPVEPLNFSLVYETNTVKIFKNGY